MNPAVRFSDIFQDRALIEDPIHEEFWQRDAEESIRQGNVEPFIEEATMQVSNWGFSLAELKLHKKQRGKGMLNWLKSLISEPQEEYIGFLGPIHIWQVRVIGITSSFFLLHIDTTFCDCSASKILY